MADLGESYTWPGVPGDAGDGLQQNWWVEAFKNEMFHLAQQKGSKLRGKVRSRSITGDATYFERFGAGTAVAKTVRGAPTPNEDTEHSRRKCVMQDYSWGKQVDEQDKRRMLVDPISAYTTSAGMTMGRTWDDLIIAAFGDDALDGTGTGIALPAGQIIAEGTTAFDLDKFIRAKEVLDTNDVDQDGRCLIISPEEESALLNLTEITSTDYNMRPTLVDGQVRRFLGCDVIVSNRLPVVTTVRDCFMWQKDCMGMAFAKDVTIRAGERPDLSYAMQVYAEFTANAVRIDDAGVVKIQNVVA
jgi:hypothetical protein